MKKKKRKRNADEICQNGEVERLRPWRSGDYGLIRGIFNHLSCVKTSQRLHLLGFSSVALMKAGKAKPGLSRSIPFCHLITFHIRKSAFIYAFPPVGKDILSHVACYF